MNHFRISPLKRFLLGFLFVFNFGGSSSRAWAKNLTSHFCEFSVWPINVWPPWWNYAIPTCGILQQLILKKKRKIMTTFWADAKPAKKYHKEREHSNHRRILYWFFKLYVFFSSQCPWIAKAFDCPKQRSWPLKDNLAKKCHSLVRFRQSEIDLKLLRIE